MTKKLSLTLLCLVSSFVDNNNNHAEGQSSYRDPSIATPDELWKIEPQPHLDFDDNYGFLFTYTVSNFIDQGQAGFYIYDQYCRSDGGSVQTVGFDTTASQITQDVTPGSVTDLTQIEMSKSVELFVKVDQMTIATNPGVFINYAPGESEIIFCVVFYLNSLVENHDDPSSALEIAVQETEVKLIVNMTKLGTGFEIRDIDVQPKDRTTTGSQLTYSTEAFLCNPEDGTEITATQQTSPFLQGSVVHVCVKPDDASLAEGIRMDAITDFGFTREGIQQQVIVDGASVEDGLTDYLPTNCFEKEWCSISTMLFASFFTAAPGSVRGNGVASIKFPAGSTNRDRGRRALQLQGEEIDDQTIQSFNMELNIASIDGDEPAPLLTVLSAATTRTGGVDTPLVAHAAFTILCVCGTLLMATIGVLI